MGVGFVAGGLPISVCTTCTCNAHSTNFVGRKVGAMWPCGLCPVSFLQSAVSRDGEFDKMENACVGLAWYPVERRNADAVTIIIIVEKSPKELNNLTREIGLFSVYCSRFFSDYREITGPVHASPLHSDVAWPSRAQNSTIVRSTEKYGQHFWTAWRSSDCHRNVKWTQDRLQGNRVLKYSENYLRFFRLILREWCGDIVHAITPHPLKIGYIKRLASLTESIKRAHRQEFSIVGSEVPNIMTLQVFGFREMPPTTTAD